MWVTVRYKAETWSICCEIPAAFPAFSTANTTGSGFAASSLFKITGAFQSGCVKIPQVSSVSSCYYALSREPGCHALCFGYSQNNAVYIWILLRAGAEAAALGDAQRLWGRLCFGEENKRPGFNVWCQPGAHHTVFSAEVDVTLRGKEERPPVPPSGSESDKQFQMSVACCW